MLISNQVGIPTINGYSGDYPAGYSYVNSPGNKRYQRSVDRWLTTNDLTTGVCSYQLTAHRWTHYKP